MANKLKTHKATRKRFKATKKGGVKHYHQRDNSHLKANKTSLQKSRQNGSGVLANKNETKKIFKLMNA